MNEDQKERRIEAMRKVVAEKQDASNFYRYIKATNPLFLGVRRRAGEGPKHFLCKALIYFMLTERGITCITEVKTEDGVYDLLDFDHRIIYEIQGDMEVDKVGLYQNDKIKDIVVIPLKGAPDNIPELITYLRGYIV